MPKLISRDFMHLESVVEELISLYHDTQEVGYTKGESLDSMNELLDLVSETTKYIKDNLDESGL